MVVMAVCAGLLGLATTLLPVDLPEDEDDNYVHETVAMLAAGPLDLNRVTAEELLAIPWLDPVLAYRIVAHRDSAGRFRSVADLRLVPGMTSDWLRLIEPYVRAGRSPGGRRAAASRLHSFGRVTLRVDTLPPAAGRAAGSAVVMVRQGPWRVALAAENDPGEPVLPDWLGGSVALDAGVTQFCAGDFTFGSALGLVFSGPHRRYADRAGAIPRGPSFVRPVRAPLETRALRGLAAEHSVGRWSLAGFGSWARRSAALGDDGEVRRIRYDGRHDDSLTLAGRRAVDERSAGARAGFNWGENRLGLNLGWLGYEPGIAPTDSLRSFHGRTLAFGGAGFDRLGHPYRLAAEVAGSSGGGMAGAAVVEGDWNSFRLALGADTRQARFFAPLGRWQSTTARKDRFSARARVRWTPGPLVVTASASSYGDYLVDSLPGRVGGELGMPLGPARLTMGIERRYRLDEPRFRRAHAALQWRPDGPLGITLEYDDGYPEGTIAHGRTVALRLEAGVGSFRFRAVAARFDIAGNARMYLSDPVVYGPGRSYSTAQSGWRFGGAVGWRLPFGRVGLNAGYALGEKPGWNAALRIEAGRP